jgi:ribosome biogenesis GTPase A
MQVAQWVGAKPSLLVLNRMDMVSAADRRAWAAHYSTTGTRAFWTDGKHGAGVHKLKAELGAVSRGVNAKRARRGLRPRPVRACVIGFPNIGKSALINRFINRKAMPSAPKPGWFTFAWECAVHLLVVS